MKDQNIKKVSSAPPKPEKAGHNASAIDQFTSGPKDATRPELGPGTSNYRSEDAKTSGWKKMARGRPKYTAVPGLPDGDIMSELAAWCSKVNSRGYGTLEPLRTRFVPRTPFDLYRMQYEGPDQTRRPELDLKRSLPEIPSFAELYGQIKDLDYIRRFYANSMGLINDLIKNTEEELKKNINPDVLKARKEFHIHLTKLKAFIEREEAKSWRKRG